MSKIPKRVSQYLWDVDMSQLSLEKNAAFIIERVLEFGDDQAVKWLLKQYSREKVKEVLVNSKRISKKTGIFYAHFFDLKPEELLCIKKPFTQRQNRF